MRSHALVVSMTTILAAVLTTAIPVRAADPIIGTCKLNVIEVLREIEGDQAGKGIQADGSPLAYRLIFPRQGGAVKTPQREDTGGFTYIETSVGPGEWYVTTMLNGKQVLIRHKAVSKDGKTKRETITGMDAQGRPSEQIEVFERQ